MSDVVTASGPRKKLVVAFGAALTACGGATAPSTASVHANGGASAAVGAGGQIGAGAVAGAAGITAVGGTSASMGGAGTGGAPGGTGGAGCTVGASELVVGGIANDFHVSQIIVDGGELFVAGQGGAFRQDLATGNRQDLEVWGPLAVDADSIFVASGDGIYRIPRSGGPAVATGTLGSADAIVLAGDDVVLSGEGKLWTMPKIGAAPIAVATLPPSTTMLAATGTRAAWAGHSPSTDGGTVICDQALDTFDVVTMTAGEPWALHATAPAPTQPCAGTFFGAIAASDGRACLVSWPDHAVHCTALAPPTPDVAVSAPLDGVVLALTVDATHAYAWVQGGTCDGLVRAALDGSPPATIAAGAIGGPIAVDATHVYFRGEQGIWRVAK